MGQSQVGDRSGVRLEMRKGLGLRSGLEGTGCLLGLKGERGVPTETSSSPPGPVPRAPPLASQLRLHSGAQTPVPFTMLVIRGPDPLFCLLLLLLVGPHNPVGASPPQRRFEYKLSFKGPRLALPGAGIPFWSHHGDAILGLEAVRLAPSMRNRSGAVWSRAPVPFSAWEVHVQMRVTGPGRRGAQGMAVWYTRGRGQVGSVLEGLASWDGIGILFDSSTEDTQNSPIIRVLASDAHTRYEPRGDAASGVLGSCRRDFRNLPNPLRVRITYWGQRLRVSLNSGLTPNDLDEVCVDVGPLLLAPGGFFGVSAATGTLADDHDILSFLTFSLSEPDPKPPPPPFLEMEQLRLVKQLEGLRARLALGAREDVIPKLSSEVQEEGKRILGLEETLGRHRQILQALQGLSRQLAQAERQWKKHLGTPGHARPEGAWDSAKVSALLRGQRSLLQDLQEMRDAAAHVVSKAQLFYLPVGTKHHFSELAQILGLLQKDLRGPLKPIQDLRMSPFRKRQPRTAAHLANPQEPPRACGPASSCSSSSFRL
ncbi:protein ERGIC-53-like isoform X3 [Prionailurus viverrinus]|uniref:protein ERGIC-53-like isoform X3 n=1 Tax=Prionailurus viverrinus TaxID=61388 RepID=UPI001FF3DFFC|nr:protein ERGIC-53-like isoform X3 [Prionailurus viverrinus]XP_047717963.1 protein ERGIC-53-like isoform X3 [Prionailurus viverrinus]